MSKAQVIDLLLNELALAAPAGFAVGLHIRYVSPLIMVNTYPEDWQEVYTAKVYGLRDPHWLGGSAIRARAVGRRSVCPITSAFCPRRRNTGCATA